MMGKTTEKYLSVLVFQREIATETQIEAVPAASEPTVEVPEFLADLVIETPVEVSEKPDPMVLQKPEETSENTPELGPATRD